MLEALTHLFALVCGQNPGHTYAPGGLLLPCCQRCAGLYAGAGLAALLHLWLRPKLSGRFLEVHGAFLLAMVPFGCHWLDQGPWLRTLIGVLFGFGLATYLWLPLVRGNKGRGLRHATGLYFLVLVGALVLLPWAACLERAFVAYVLSGWMACGALALLGLVLADAALGLAGAASWLRRQCGHRFEA
jgi:uncharacterized membrane protein